MSIMSVVQALNQVGSLTGVIKPETSKKIENRTALLETNGSITRLLSSTVVEPIVIVSENAYQSEKVEGAINLSLDLFTSYYLQAFKILTQLNGLQSNEAIRVLSTKSGTIEDMTRVPKQIESVKSTALALSKSWMALNNNIEKALDAAGVFKEDYVESLLNDNVNLFGNTTFSRVKTEAIIKTNDLPVSSISKNNREEKSGISLEKFYIKEFELKVKWPNFGDGDEKKAKYSNIEVLIPITVRAIVIKSPIESILALCKPYGNDRSFASRWDDWKSGSISLCNLLFAGDLIREYKNEKLRTGSELNKLLNSRIGQSVSKLATQGMRGFEANYNMLVLSSNDVPKLNKYLRGDVFKEKYKEEVLEQAHAIATTILDDDYERMSLLIRDNYGVSTASYKKISDKKANEYDAIIEMMHALTAGRNLQF